MPVSDLDEDRVARLLAKDVASTIGPGHQDLIRSTASHHRQFADQDDGFVDRVVNDVQQFFHDTRIDTTWPACPSHPDHPMWCERGWWHADGEPVAPLGELGDWLADRGGRRS
jgi:hypothetical protein